MYKFQFITSLFLFFSWSLTAQITFVNQAATGADNGSSWADAYTDLQTALQNSSSGEVWVAAGVYYPTADLDRTISFTLKNNLALYGGFLGGETLLEQRDLETNHTILSGEIGNQSTNSDNSYHVVVAKDVDNSAILDGFQVKYGLANGSGIDRNGGGILFLGNNENSSPVIRNCKISENTASGSGGGIAMDLYHFGATTLNILIEKCTFANNTASSYGGALSMVVDISTSVEIDFLACIFDRNSSNFAGGAVYGYEGSVGSQNLRFYNCLFTNNQATGGGAVEFYGAYAVDFTHNTFYENFGTNGHHVLKTNASSTVNFNNSIIWGSPSGIYLPLSATVAVNNSILKGGIANGSDIWNIAPKLADPSSGQYYLADCSNSINIGDNALTPAFLTSDLLGNPRSYGGKVDLGAFEHQGFSPSNFNYVSPGNNLLTEYCPNGSWTHYAAAASPNEFLFSIEHFPDEVGGNTNLFTASPVLNLTANASSNTDFVDGIFKAEDIPNLEAIFAMGRYWNVQLTEGSLNGFVNVRFYYQPGELAAIEQAADDWMLANGGGMSSATYWVKTATLAYDPLTQLTPQGLTDGFAVSGTPGITSNGTNYIQLDSISSFSGGTAVVRVSDNNPVLPVELLNFTAVRKGQEEVDLAWAFSYESQNYGFEVERRLQTEQDFRSVGFVESQGPTITPRSYQFEDQNEYRGWSYYRLKIIGLDGQVDYSQVQVVEGLNRQEEIIVFPNPTQQSVQLILPDKISAAQSVQVTLTNTLQQIVRQSQIKGGATNIVQLEGLEGLSAGVYFLRVEMNGKNYASRLLISE